MIVFIFYHMVMFLRQTTNRRSHHIIQNHKDELHQDTSEDFHGTLPITILRDRDGIIQIEDVSFQC